MRIVHIAAGSPYNEGWSYQENLLPKYQRKMGHEVYLLTTNRMQKDGGIVEVEETEYMNEDQVSIFRLHTHVSEVPWFRSYFNRLDVWETLINIQPDFIHFHGLIDRTLDAVTKYKKNVNHDVIIVADNHLDYQIGYSSKSFWDKIKKELYRYRVKKNIRFVDKVYGVTPWRMKYAEDFFKVPQEKIDLLIMGADDEAIDFDHKLQIRKMIREKYDIKKEDFLIITGGKIDKNKKIDVLIEACGNMDRIKLLVFGSIHKDEEFLFNGLFEKYSNVKFIGWLDSKSYYDYCFASDLVVYPGQHSVLWEQACATKVPCMFAKWDGMDHVNNGGNATFFSPVTKEVLKNEIAELVFTEKYYRMKAIAESEATDIYLYGKIAIKSLECLKDEM